MQSELDTWWRLLPALAKGKGCAQGCHREPQRHVWLFQLRHHERRPSLIWVGEKSHALALIRFLAVDRPDDAGVCDGDDVEGGNGIEQVDDLLPLKPHLLPPLNFGGNLSR